MTTQPPQAQPDPEGAHAFDAAATQMVAIRSPSSWHSVGPLVLGLVIGIQCTLWAFDRWQQRPVQPSVLAQMTRLGQANYNPDNDVVIYLGGLLLSLALALGLSAAWKSRMRRFWTPVHEEDRNFMAGLHGLVALAVVGLRLAHSASGILSLAAAALGSIWFAWALWLAGQPGRHAGWASRLKRRLPFMIEFIGIPVLIGLAVWIPQPAELVGMAYSIDHFHHLDFYAMAPALAFRHGIALGTDFYTQYGVGWPMVLAMLSLWVAPLSYGLFFKLSVVWGCIYFLSCYVFLRLLLRSRGWALTGLLLGVSMSLMGGTEESMPKWLWPSSTVMRYAMDMTVFSFLLLHARTGKSWLAMPAGACLALALLFGTDTGLYLMTVFLVYGLVGIGLPNKRSGFRARFGFGSLALASFTGVLLFCLTWASRGTLWQPAFWLGWTESLRLYGGGFSHLPVGAALVRGWSAYLLLVLMLGTYLLAVARSLHAAWLRRLTPDRLVLGLVALYGLETLLQFIGRSHPFNLFHTAIPFCAVLVYVAAELAAWASTGLAAVSRGSLPKERISQILSVLAALVVAGALAMRPTFRNYPNLLHVKAQALSNGKSKGDSGFLFVSRREGMLGPEFKEDVHRFRAITTTLRELSDGGRRTVAMVDSADTAYLIEADIAPYFRYSPVLMNLVYLQQVNGVSAQLQAHPPDYLVLPKVVRKLQAGLGAEDAHGQLLNAVQLAFVPDRTLEDWVVYRRR